MSKDIRFLVGIFNKYVKYITYRYVALEFVQNVGYNSFTLEFNDDFAK